MIENEIYSNKIVTGSRTYFFDIKQTKKGDYYINISENKKTETGIFERHQVMIFNEDLDEFAKVFENIVTKIKELQVEKKEVPTLNKQRFTTEKVRENHQQAFLPWTKEDDEKLEQLFGSGKGIEELAIIFARQKGAIITRIKKLELTK